MSEAATEIPNAGDKIDENSPKYETYQHLTDIEHYVIRWSIDNLAAFPRKLRESLHSPWFTLVGSESSWRFSLLLNEKKSSGNVLYIHRLQNDDGPDSVAVTFRFGVEGSQTETEWFAAKSVAEFDWGYYEDYPLTRDQMKTFMQKRSEDALLVCCEMYVSFEHLELDKESEPTPQELDLVNLSNSLLKVMSSKESTDFCIQIPHYDILVHKAVLAARSSFFFDMFQKGQPASVKLCDMSYGNVVSLLTFMYSGSLDLAAMNKPVSIGLYECAVRLGVRDMVKMLSPRQLKIRSRLETERMEVVWNIKQIQRFLEGTECVKSREFTADSLNESRWKMLLSAHSVVGDDSATSLRAETTKLSKYVHAALTVSLLKRDGEKFCSSSASVSTHQDNSKIALVIPEFFEKSLLIENAGDFVLDDSIKVLCEISFLASMDFFEEHKFVLSTSCVSCPRLRRLSRDLGTLYSSKMLADVTLVTDQGTFRVHKVILFARSRVLASRLLYDKSKSNVVHVTDIDAEELAVIIEHAYTGFFEAKGFENLFKMCKSSIKYSFYDLGNTCLLHLLPYINTKNFFSILREAIKTRNCGVTSKILEFVKENIGEIRSSREWRYASANKDEVQKFLVEWMDKL